MPRLDWLTRDQDLTAADRVPFRLLDAVPEESFGEPSENLLVQGDNLEALKALLPFYAGQVKCIYIDPPYNTRSAFEHYDDSLEHAKWLAMIVPRLQLLREFLREDGSIWVSIDDNEGHYLKVLMDEVFGRRNFIVTVAWQKRDGPPNDRKIGLTHEHLLIYAASREDTSKQTIAEKAFNLMPRTAKANSQYDVFREPDGPDPRGPFRKVDSTTNAKGGRNVDSLIFPLKNRFTGEEVFPRTGRNWAHNREEMERLNRDKRLYWGVKGTAGTPMKKLFLNEAKQGMTAPSVWSNTGLNQHASSEMERVFGTKAFFETPKPEALIQRIFQIATNPGDWVLDSFLGSGTTAAVAQKMGRRWIGVEMGDHARTHCALRLRKVIDGEQGGISKDVGWQGGGGFRFATLGPAVFLADGTINPEVRFTDLARHVWFSETREPMADAPDGPFLGQHDGRGIALLFNGILKDRSAQGGNVLTHAVLKLIRESSGFDGPLTVYGAACRLSDATLEAKRVTFRQTPYEIKARV